MRSRSPSPRRSGWTPRPGLAQDHPLSARPGPSQGPPRWDRPGPSNQLPLSGPSSSKWMGEGSYRLEKSGSDDQGRYGGPSHPPLAYPADPSRPSAPSYRRRSPSPPPLRRPQSASPPPPLPPPRPRVTSGIAPLPAFLPQRPNFSPPRKRPFNGDVDSNPRPPPIGPALDDREERGRPPVNSVPLGSRIDRRDDWERRRESDAREKDRQDRDRDVDFRRDPRDRDRLGPPRLPGSAPVFDRTSPRRSPWPDRGPQPERSLPPHLAPRDPGLLPLRRRSPSPPFRHPHPRDNPPLPLGGPRSNTRFSSPYSTVPPPGRPSYPPPPPPPNRYPSSSRSSYPPPPPMSSFNQHRSDSISLDYRDRSPDRRSPDRHPDRSPSRRRAASPPPVKRQPAPTQWDRPSPTKVVKQEVMSVDWSTSPGWLGENRALSSSRASSGKATDSNPWAPATTRASMPPLERDGRPDSPRFASMGPPSRPFRRTSPAPAAPDARPPSSTEVPLQQPTPSQPSSTPSLLSRIGSPVPDVGHPAASLPSPRSTTTPVDLPAPRPHERSPSPVPVSTHLPPLSPPHSVSPPDEKGSTSPKAGGQEGGRRRSKSHSPQTPPSGAESTPRVAASPSASAEHESEQVKVPSVDPIAILRTDLCSPSPAAQTISLAPLSSPVKPEPESTDVVALPAPVGLGVLEVGKEESTTASVVVEPSSPKVDSPSVEEDKQPLAPQQQRSASKSPSFTLQTLLNPSPTPGVVSLPAVPKPVEEDSSGPVEVDVSVAEVKEETQMDVEKAVGEDGAEDESGTMDVEPQAGSPAPVEDAPDDAEADRREDADADMSVSRESLSQDELLDLMKAHVATQAQAAVLPEEEIGNIIGFNACLVDPFSSRIPARSSNKTTLNSTTLSTSYVPSSKPLFVPGISASRQAAVRTAVGERVERSLVDQAAHLRDVRKEYKTLNNEWQATCARLDRVTEKRKAKRVPVNPHARTPSVYTPGGASSAPTQAFDDFRPGRTSRSTRGNYPEQGYFGDAVRSEAEFQSILASLGDADYLDPNLRAARTAAVVPDMVLNRIERDEDAYDDCSGLVLDPDAFYNISHSPDVWTDEEKEIFYKKFASHPKQFGKIADALAHKTAAQCVLFYYRNKKLVNFRTIVAQRGGGGRRKGGRRAGKASRLMANLEGKRPKKPVIGEPVVSTQDGDASGPSSPKPPSEGSMPAPPLPPPTTTVSAPSTNKKRKQPSILASLKPPPQSQTKSVFSPTDVNATPTAASKPRNGKSLLGSLLSPAPTEDDAAAVLSSSHPQPSAPTASAIIL